MEKLMKCPDCLPSKLQKHIQVLAHAWIQCPIRPRVEPDVMRRWDQLVKRWADDPKMPLYIRHGKQRGCELTHKKSRRIIVPADNSVAHWAFYLALRGDKLDLKKVKKLIKDDRIPVAMILKTEELECATYKCTVKTAKMPLNDYGWKICHIEKVGLGRIGDVETHSIEELKSHFIRYIRPSNMFLVPKQWGGLGEMPDMIKAAQAHHDDQVV